ncbi:MULTISPECIES: flagellar export protein FliJ [Ureibacillus]|jgi:flagellar FliJ protein|uniref:Flagellar FliJ protein n=1 Tax=Ureibacillus thermosphaericus TaxID=51173 RepID=A0A840PHH9_URETH|nr:flagellar export protein FliJ [Ureibacillus thermosphaericus]MBB5147875.1 flagellar FliJ protein [Ureibacillus thermosphaericus]NKZ30323.1 flagellar export protein FliJ [Ureibacillus thermosphaericus]
MVQYTYRFEKLLTIREQEKQQTEMAYKESVRSFEKVATQLYELLKKKENLIEYQNERLKNGLTIDEIHHFAKFIDSLEHTIDEVQQKVKQARVKMQWYEQKLVEKNLEVRKYEKMREKDYSAFQEEQNRLEAQHLDEISSLMYNKKIFR